MGSERSEDAIVKESQRIFFKAKLLAYDGYVMGQVMGGHGNSYGSCLQSIVCQWLGDVCGESSAPGQVPDVPSYVQGEFHCADGCRLVA